MKPEADTAIRSLGVALLLGIGADAILRVVPWGLNAALFVWSLAAGIGLFAPAVRKRWALLIAVYGTFFLWRDSPVLKALDVVAIGAVCLTIVLPHAIERILNTTFVQHAGAACDAAVGMIAGSALSIRTIVDDISPGFGVEETRRNWIRIALNGAVGLCISIPLVLLFGALFVSADVAFRGFVQRIFDANWDKLLQHGFIITLVTWICGGYLRVVATDARAGFPLESTANALRLEALSVFIPLALLNALFITFIAVQFKYFFGDSSLVTDPAGPTYSEYARQGFFQLVAVAVLALLVLYGGDWLQRDAVASSRKLFRVLATLLIALVFFVMASAFHRMYLYYNAYGLTQLRLYTTVFMVWLAAVLVVFSLTVLWGSRERFVMIAVSFAWAAVVALHAMNPDATIVRANAARAESGASFDAAYNGQLSADAAPALLDLRGIENAQVARDRMADALKAQSSDWRTWNWSRHAAMKLLGESKNL